MTDPGPPDDAAALRAIAERFGIDEATVDAAAVAGTLGLVVLERLAVPHDARYTQADVARVSGLGEDAAPLLACPGLPGPGPRRAGVHDRGPGDAPDGRRHHQHRAGPARQRHAARPRHRPVDAADRPDPDRGHRGPPGADGARGDRPRRRGRPGRGAGARDARDLRVRLAPPPPERHPPPPRRRRPAARGPAVACGRLRRHGRVHHAVPGARGRRAGRGGRPLRDPGPGDRRRPRRARWSR